MWKFLYPDGLEQSAAITNVSKFVLLAFHLTNAAIATNLFYFNMHDFIYFPLLNLVNDAINYEQLAMWPIADGLTCVR